MLGHFSSDVPWALGVDFWDSGPVKRYPFCEIDLLRKLLFGGCELTKHLWRIFVDLSLLEEIPNSSFFFSFERKTKSNKVGRKLFQYILNKPVYIYTCSEI